ncbi:NUDIX domain-containing protein [Kribbella sp. NPDC023972]|uniref:NUDIX hydrolase n=1 Tax=Kribbella sp. NPDC023972 TaxID=3154795 RepID=UPI0033C931FC
MQFTDYDTRLAAYALIVDDADRMLLTWYVGGQHARACWTMPGGGVEYDESPQQAVVREVFEETGYTVDVGAPIAVHTSTEPHTRRSRRPYKAVRVVFAATITGGSLGTTELNGTTAYAQWVPLDQVASLSPRADIIDVALAKHPARVPGSSAD